MKNVDKYLRVLQEQFNARIALEDISGDFKDEWTDCYETRCHRRFENKYEKNICKDDCRLRSTMRAIGRINSAKAKCSGATEPNRCINTLENGILKMSYPDNPRHPKQTYVLTETGFKFPRQFKTVSL